MISKSLSTSEKRAALHQTAGKLAEFCQAIYPLLVAHADDWGCLQGDPFTVKHLVDPTSPRRLVDFEAALVALHNVGLIMWYEAEGRRVIHIRGWFAHQHLKGHDKEGRKREFPEPPENPSKIESFAQSRPKVPKSALREEKRTEEKRTEPIQTPQNPGSSEAEDRRKEDNAEVAKFIGRFCELYAKRRNGARYFIKRERHVPLIRRLLGVYGLERLVKLAAVLLQTDDDWVQHTDRGIEILSVKANWLEDRLAAYEAEHGPIKVAS